MSRYFLGILTLAWLLGGHAAFGQDKKPTLSWFGQSFFLLETSKGTRIAFDPHIIEAYGRSVMPADLVLMSHSHSDHTQLAAIENRDRAKIIPGWKGNLRNPDWNLIDEKFQDVRVRSVGVYHDESMGMERGKSTVFIIEADGLVIAHLGDLGHSLSPEQLRKIGAVDVLMIPVGGVYALNGSDAKKVVEQIKPRRLILPMHYGTRVFDDLLGPEEFLEGQKAVKRALASNDVVLDPNSPVPDQPTIMLLGWKKAESK